MEPPALSFEQLIALVGRLRDRVAELERENARLRGELDRLKKDKPASGPPPFVKGSLPARRKRKKPGRPAGHAAALRPPPPEIHQEIQVPLARGEGGACLCPHCSGELIDIKTHERVVEDIVPSKPQVTRYHTSSGYCKHCKKRVESRHPGQPPAADLPHGQIGLNALSAAAALKHDAGLPYRKVAVALYDLCRLSVSPGALPKQVRRVAGWLEGPCEVIKASLRAGPYVNADETGWRIDGVNAWLWALTNPKATLFQVDARRDAKVVRDVLGEDFAGHLVTDFLPTYNKLPYKSQKCIPHLLRDLKRSGERSPPFAASTFCKKLKRAAHDMLRLKKRWDQFSDDAYSMRASRIADRLDALGRTRSDDKDINRLAKRLRRHARGMAEFLLVKELPGDNNAAERAIRPAVVIRKISGGHRGPSTAKASATVMSVLRTIRQQGRNLIGTLTQLIESHLAGKPCDLLAPDAQ
jgi:hypothetical protein